MRLLLRALAPLLLALLAIAAACGGGEAKPAGDRDQQQVLRANLGAEPASLDPQRASDFVSISVLQNIYATLLRLNERQQLEPYLARELPSVENGGISADGLAYTFRLREGLRWSDGTPLLARDLVNGAKRLFAPGGGSPYVDFYRVLAADGFNEQVEALLARMDPRSTGDREQLERLERAVVEHLQVSAPDERTVVYRLRQRSPVFLLLATLWPLAPVRQDLVDRYGERWTEAGTLVSNGPFTLAEWKHNERIVLARNDRFHGQAPALERVELEMITDRALAFLAYRAGRLDTTTLGPPELVQVRGDEQLRGEFRAYGQLSTSGVTFNLGAGPLSNLKVRQALAGGFDRVQYAEAVREGAVLPAYGWVPPGMPGWDEQAGKQYADALERSRQLLAEAGYPGGSGLALEILGVQAGNSPLTTQWLKQQWEQLGIKVAVVSLEPTAYLARRRAGDFQVVEGSWGADYPDPHNWLPLFRTGGLLNSGKFSDPEYDRLVDRAAAELDNDRRLELYRQAQRRLLDQVPFAPAYHGRRNVLVKPWVQGLQESPMEAAVPGDRFFDRVYIRGRR